MFRNPFDNWTNAMPRPKKFGMPNQTPSVQNRMLSQSNPWREEIFNDTMTNPMPSQTQTPEQPGNEWGSYLAEMKDLYTRQGPSQQAYEQHLKNLPQYQKPGKMHRLGSVLVGAATGFQQGAGAGFQAGQEALNLPHRRAMEEWSTREQGLGRQAEMEDKATGRRLSYMKEVRETSDNEAQYRKAMRELDQKDAAQQSLDNYRTAQIENMERQGWTTYVDNAGDRISYNPRTGDKRNMGPDQKKRDWELDERRIRDSERRTGIQGGQLGVARGNLAERRRSGDLAERNEGNRFINAAEQSDARTSAQIRVAAADPKFKDLITPEGQVNPQKAAENPELYQRFISKVEAEERGILGRRREVVYDYDDDDEG